MDIELLWKQSTFPEEWSHVSESLGHVLSISPVWSYSTLIWLPLSLRALPRYTLTYSPALLLAFILSYGSSWGSPPLSKYLPTAEYISPSALRIIQLSHQTCISLHRLFNLYSGPSISRRTTPVQSLLNFSSIRSSRCLTSVSTCS